MCANPGSCSLLSIAILLFLPNVDSTMSLTQNALSVLSVWIDAWTITPSATTCLDCSHESLLQENEVKQQVNTKKRGHTLIGFRQTPDPRGMDPWVGLSGLGG